jgi:hypothetical protein
MTAPLPALILKARRYPMHGTAKRAHSIRNGNGSSQLNQTNSITSYAKLDVQPVALVPENAADFQ